MENFTNYRDDISILILVFICMIVLWYLTKSYDLEIAKKTEKIKVKKIKEEINEILYKDSSHDSMDNIKDDKDEEIIPAFEKDYKVEEIETLAKNNLMDSPLVEEFEEKPARNATYNVAGGEERIDDLTIIEGIGPKIQELLYTNNIKNFEKLSRTNTLYLQNILDQAGNSFNMANPKTWAEQARLAHENKWEELDEYQNELYAGL